MVLKSLKPLQGFSADYRQQKLDKTAFTACVKTIGREKTEAILETWHRPASSLELVREGILKFNRSSHKPRPTDPAYSMVIQSVIRDFVPKAGKIIPLSTGAVFKHPDFPRTKAPGLPWSEQGFKNKKEVGENDKARGKIIRDWDLIGRGFPQRLPDCQAFQRVIASVKEKTKVRPVWGYPTHVMSEEGRFFYPYIDFVKRRKDDHCYGIGLEIARGGMAYINDMLNSRFQHTNSVIASLDWGEFDTRILAWLIRDAFAILELSFDFSHIQSEDGRIWPVKEIESRRRWKKCIDYFINTPIRLADGSRYQKSSGVPSGSAWTNVIDTICNAIIVRYTAYHTTGHLPEGDIYYGDDSVCVFRRPFDLQVFGEFSDATFDSLINDFKSVVTSVPKNTHFLGFYNNYGMPYRESDFLLASFLLPEHSVKTPLESATRALGQLYSCQYEPQAYVWFQILKEIQEYAQLENDAINAEVQANYAKRFKYLVNLGYDIQDIVVPDDKVYDAQKIIVGIAPPSRPTRSYGLARNYMDPYLIYSWPFFYNYDPGDTEKYDDLPEEPT